MTRLLEEALQVLDGLPSSEQDAIAALILEQIQADRQWDAAFGASQNELAELAREALDEHRAGRTTVLDPDNL